MKRLTTDEPKSNLEAMLNYAYAKDGKVYLSYADGEEHVDLCEYIAKNACCEEVDANAVMEGACMECDCKTAILNVVAIQAAELRERLEYYEDLEEAGRLVVLPCKVGDTVYFRTYAKNATVDLGIQPHKVITYRLSMVCEGECCGTELPEYEFGRSVFLAREEAEKALEGTK